MTNKPPREFFLFKDGSCIECDGYKVKRPDISESCILLIEEGPVLEKIKRLEKELEHRTNLLRSCYGFVVDADRVGIITAELESILEGR